jgi:hypothetical protein
MIHRDSNVDVEIVLAGAELSEAIRDEVGFSRIVELAGRIVDLDGSQDTADLTDAEVVAAAKLILREQIGRRKEAAAKAKGAGPDPQG